MEARQGKGMCTRFVKVQVQLSRSKMKRVRKPDRIICVAQCKQGLHNFLLASVTREARNDSVFTANSKSLAEQHGAKECFKNSSMPKYCTVFI